MPQPVSVTVRVTKRPAWVSALRRTYSVPMSSAWVAMRKRPPLGMASRPLTARFMMTCSIMPASASTHGKSAA